MPFVPLAAMGALIFTAVNFLKFLTSKNWSAVITQLVSWAAGVAVLALVASTDFAEGIAIGDTSLAKLGGSSLFFVGLMASSIFGFAKVALQAVDGHDSAVQAPLVPVSNGE